jgi:pimeloyl-ACP methyl ester carboxylesterase
MPSPSTIAPVALFHRDLGGSGEPPIVLLHGMLGSSRNWQVAGRELAASRRVFALDMRNHGFSPHSGEMTYDAMAADVAAWLDANGIKSAELVGHSMGGKVAMLLACRQPWRVGRLVVVDIAPKGYHWPAYRQEYAAMNAIDLETLRSRAQAEAQMESQVPEWSMRKFLTTNLERLDGGGWRWMVNLPVLSASIAEFERNPIAEADQIALRPARGRGDDPQAFSLGPDRDDRQLRAQSPHRGPRRVRQGRDRGGLSGRQTSASTRSVLSRFQRSRIRRCMSSGERP